MFSQLLAAAWIGVVPDVATGPDLADRATPIDAPIATVQVFSDRARITRSARVDVRRGISVFRLPDLPGATWMDTIRADGRGAKVLRVEAIPVVRDRVSIDQVEELLTNLERITDEIALLDAELAARDHELAAVTGLRPAPPAPEQDRKGAVRWDIGSWDRVLGFFSAERNRMRSERRAIEATRRDKARDLVKAQREVQRMNLGAFSDQKVQVILLVSATKKGRASLSLDYDIPGAYWKPAYDLRYDAKAGKVLLETYGVVSQATGESWDHVDLRLSTAIPGRDIALPSLLTWTLGEAKEFIPQPRARRTPPRAPRYPVPQATSNQEEMKRQARLQLLQRRLAELTRLAQTNVEQSGWYKTTTTIDFSSVGVSGNLVTPDGASFGRADSNKKRSKVSRRNAPSRPRPAPSRPQSAPMSSRSMDESVSADAESGPSLGSLFESSPARVRNTPLALFERDTARGPRLNDADLPAVSAGGLDFVYRAQTKMTVPSTGELLRAPLQRATYPVAAFYEAAPALAPNAYLKATVKNSSLQPILRGPVTIFVNDSFAGDGRLETTGAGGTLQLPFGADEDIKLVRKVVPVTETKGVFSKDEVTTYRVIMEIVNYKRRAVTVVVREPLPRSKTEEVKVERVKVTPPPSVEADDDNILRWDIEIPAGRKRTIEMTYRITRPDGWQLGQQ